MRLVAGLGFCQHGWAKLVRGPDAFIAILHAMGLPFAPVLGWATIVVELLGGLAVLVGAFVALASVPMIVVLLVGGFGYVVYDAMSPGFYFAPVATGRSVWLGSQALLLAVYLAGAILTFSAALREQLRWPQSLLATADNVIG